MAKGLPPSAIERYRRDGFVFPIPVSEPDVVTAWFAFTDATLENGAMRMMPGSHGEPLAKILYRDTGGSVTSSPAAGSPGA